MSALHAKMPGILANLGHLVYLEIVVAISALLFGAEQVAGLAEDDRQFEFQHVPDYTMVDFGIAVDENVAEGDDPLVFADLRGGRWIGLS